MLTTSLFCFCCLSLSESHLVNEIEVDVCCFWHKVWEFIYYVQTNAIISPPFPVLQWDPYGVATCHFFLGDLFRMRPLFVSCCNILLKKKTEDGRMAGSQQQVQASLFPSSALMWVIVLDRNPIESLHSPQTHKKRLNVETWPWNVMRQTQVNHGFVW